MNRFRQLSVVGALASRAYVGAAAPTEAHVGTIVAIGAGLLGLGVCAAIAADHPHYYGGHHAPPPPPPPS